MQLQAAALCTRFVLKVGHNVNGYDKFVNPILHSSPGRTAVCLELKLLHSWQQLSKSTVLMDTSKDSQL